MMARVWCWVVGQALAEMERLPLNHASRLRYLRCGAQWVAHDEYGWFRWNDEFEGFYRWLRR
jgi:hypothetical protein